MTPVHAYYVTVKGAPSYWGAYVNAHSVGRAKVQYWRSVNEAWPDIPYTAIRARKVSNAAHTPAGFPETAAYRGFPGLKCGQRVRVGEGTGTIVGSNSSANFNVLFDLDSPTYAGLVLNVHPQADNLVLL